MTRRERAGAIRGTQMTDPSADDVIDLPRTIRETFAGYFANWHIELPSQIPHARGVSLPNDHGWYIAVRYDRGDPLGALEVYAGHRMTNDRHFAIRDDADVMDLDAVPDFMVYPRDASDAERADIQERHFESKRRIYQQLEDRGLRQAPAIGARRGD